ncbi:hypothetical protein BDK51DRAFT_27423 [Blyttiomyces helicus]|uniref:Seipin n=1 Tax=Blyttiomyces helicus TaxID=388810 RepID=A0A4P9VZ01_9FUNG|nr:hypothetical protein BDK51DRAFT_27423 [Blyttiomyces helicus]|eukprot:RKO83026.1 hypothetical protein BDK51DRAFT_27423 [Blyttiomyces helicus]
MVHIELQTKDNKTLASSSRPVLLKYKTPLLRNAVTVWKLVPLLLGITSEAQSITVPLLEKYEERVLYETSLHIEASFQGLRFFMYHWRITTAALFVSVFTFWEAIYAFLIWRLLLSFFNSPAKDGGAEAAAEAVEIRGREKRVRAAWVPGAEGETAPAAGSEGEDGGRPGSAAPPCALPGPHVPFAPPNDAPEGSLFAVAAEGGWGTALVPFRSLSGFAMPGGVFGASGREAVPEVANDDDRTGAGEALQECPSLPVEDAGPGESADPPIVPE